VGVVAAVPEADAVVEPVLLGVGEPVGEFDALAPDESDAVGDALSVPLALTVELGVPLGVCDAEAVAVLLGVALGVPVAEPVGDVVGTAVPLGDEPAERLGVPVGDALGVVLAVALALRVHGGAVSEADALAVPRAPEADGEPLALPGAALALAAAPAERAALREAEPRTLTLMDAVLRALPALDTDCEALALPLSAAERLGTRGVAHAVDVAAGARLTLAQPDALGEPALEREGVATTDADAEASVLREEDARDELDLDAGALVDAVTDAVSDALALEDALAVAPEAEAERTPVTDAPIDLVAEEMGVSVVHRVVVATTVLDAEDRAVADAPDRVEANEDVTLEDAHAEKDELREGDPDALAAED
jgi:hypothetical protein